MANPIAVPGTVVSSGAGVSPGGAQGVQGVQGTTGPTGPGAWTTNTAQFTVPNVGATTSVTVANASWITVGEMIYVATAGGSGQAGVLQVTAIASNTLTVLNPQPAPAIPLANNVQSGLMARTSGNTTDFIDGTNASQNLVTAITPQIWSVRYRSFSSIGNGTFEVDQRNAATSVPVQSQSWAVDRWLNGGAGTWGATVQQVPTAVVIPGTNYLITQNILRSTVTTVQASLGTNDWWQIWQVIEGPMLRELLGDVHSVSILARSSVANLKFGLYLGDTPGTHLFTHLCSLGAANTWTLVTCPNIPIWMGAATWTVAPGTIGYTLGITLAAGASKTASANDTWLAASTPIGAPGQSNFAANAGATFDLAYVMHEPGSQTSTLQDVPFIQNLDSCLRYYQKTYPYGTVPGTATQNGMRAWMALVNGITASGPHSFLKVMAKVPTALPLYNYATGAAGSVRDGTGVDHGSAFAGVPGDSGFSYIGFTGAVAAPTQVYAHYVADTGF
jgi:hypothetical protein